MKVLIIGLGSIAKKHIAALKSIISNVEIYALRSGLSEKVEKHENVINIYNLNEIDLSIMEFVIISNPTSKHYNSLRQLVDFNVPLFIEKPVFSDVGVEMENLVKLYNQKKTITYVACNLRFLECIVNLKNILRKERVNEVNVYCGSYLPEWRTTGDFRKTYSANKELGGGVHIDLIHELDYLYWLFGPPKETQSFFSSKSSLEITAYDYANYLWKYNEFSANIVLNYYRQQSKRIIEVVTVEDTFVVNLLNNSIVKNDKLVFSSDKRIFDTYLTQMKYFLNNMNKGLGIEFNSIGEAYEVLKLCIRD